MIKLTIKEIGTPKDVQTKYGMKSKNWIKAEEYSDNFLSYWVGQSTKDWRVGDTVEVESVDSREYNGKTYYDIKMPKVDNRPAPLSDSKLEQIINNQVKHGLALAKIEELLTRLTKIESVASDYPEMEDEPAF